jgi:deoxyribodipyrimidine photo-lyase
MRALVWFRSDLRTLDNAALFHAAKASDGGVVALFVVSPGQWKQHDYAPAKVDLMLRTLAELSHALGQYNIALKVRVADRIADVPGVVAQTMKELGCDTLHYNKEYELDEVRRDEKTAALIQKAGGKVFAHSDQCLIEPGDVRTGEGKFFTVYSPFKRASYKLLSSQGGVKEFPVPRKQHGMVSTPDAVPAVVEGFESSVDPKFWPGGEKHALSQLRTFAEKHVEPYKAQRDFPGIRGTSMLSPYLTIGAISPRQCIVAAVQANTHARKNNTSHIGSVKYCGETFTSTFWSASRGCACTARFSRRRKRLRGTKIPSTWMRGSTVGPVCPSWTPACGNCSKWGGCTIACA